MPTIEDIILDNDQRGVAALRQHLSADYCRRAATYALANPGTTLIATGFYISVSGAPETDGPPAALAIGRSLETLGQRVAYVTDRYTTPILGPAAGPDSQVIEFPIADDQASSKFASELLTGLDPSLLISIERCGLTEAGTYHNMRGVDISPHTARIDHLFLQHTRTIGIGDGGNEIGMGNLSQYIPNIPTLPANPAVTTTTHLILASTSNWGGYGLVAALSRLAGRNLLPDPDDEATLIRRMVDMGAVDGVTGEAQYSVDGMSIEEHGHALSRLHDLLNAEGVPA